MANNQEFEAISVGYITSDQQNNKYFNRIADIEKDRLVPPRRDPTDTDGYFSKRNSIKLKYQDASSVKYRDYVVLWWNASKNTKHDSPILDYPVGSIQKNQQLTIVYFLNYITSEDRFIEKVSNGLSKFSTNCNLAIVYPAGDSSYRGIYVKREDFTIEQDEDGLDRVVLSKNKKVFPSYEFSKDEIFRSAEISYGLILGEITKQISGYVFFGDQNSILKEFCLSTLNWKKYNQITGNTKRDWNTAKDCLRMIFENKDIYSEFVNNFGGDTFIAKNLLDNFNESAKNCISAMDVSDSSFFVDLIKNNDDLKDFCLEKYKLLNNQELEKIKAQKQSQIEELDAEIEQYRIKKENELNSKIQNLQSEVEKLTNDVVAKKAELETIEDSIITKKNEQLGDEVIASIKDKIATARNDLSSFISELSVILSSAPVVQESAPIVNNKGGSEPSKVIISKTQSWNNVPSIDENAEDPTFNDDHIYALQVMLSNFKKRGKLGYDFVNEKLRPYLTAFMYAANLNKLNLLAVGPGSYELANAVSLSNYGKTVSTYNLGNEFDSSMISAVAEDSSDIVFISNMFGKGWSDALPQLLSSVDKQIIFNHPYVEDLIAEPKGLYNYAYPLLTEFFVTDIPNINKFSPAAKSEEFQDFKSEYNDNFIDSDKNFIEKDLLGSFGLSSLVLNKIDKVISDANDLIENSNTLGDLVEKDHIEYDLQFLFAVLPFYKIMGKTNLIKLSEPRKEFLSKSVCNIIDNIISSD